MVKNRTLVAKKGPKTKKSLLNPLIRELYKVTADINKATSLEDIVKLGETIESKEGSFLAPSYNINRVDAANDLIAHLNQENATCKVRAVETENGLGLVATEGVEKGEKLIRLPVDQCISTIDRADQKLPMAEFKKDPVISNMMNVQLALNLLFEVFEGKDSKFYHYLRTLPTRPQTVLSMAPEELFPLKGSSLWMEIEPMIIAIHRQYARVHQLIQNAQNDRRFDRLRDNFSFSAYKWAVQIIQTRQNGYPGMNNMELNDLFLIPIVDLCNHSAESSVRLMPEGAHAMAMDVAVCLASLDTVAPEQPLTLTYSPTTTGDFFIHSGFVPSHIEADASKIRITLPKQNADWRWSLLSQLPINSPFPVGAENIPYGLINFIRIFLMSEDQAKAKFEHIKTANKIDLTLGDDEPKVFQFLVSRLKLMLMRLDKALADCPSDSGMAFKLLTNERDNFQAAVDYIVQLQS